MSEEAVKHQSYDEQDTMPIVRQGGVEDLARRMDPVKIYRGVLRRIWLVILFSVVCALGFGYIGQQLSGSHTAEAYVIFEKDAPKQLLGGYPLGHFTMASAVEMITLPSHLNAVRSILGLELDEQQLLGMIEVLPPLSDSNLINITVTADNPSLAVDIANTLASVVVKNAQDFTKRQLKVAYDYYRNQVDTLQDKIAEKVGEISEFRKDHSFFEVNPEGAIAVRGLVDLEQRMAKARAEYNGLLVQYENLRREVTKLPDQVVRYSQEDSPLQRRLTQAELALLEARTRYAAKNPKVKALEAEVDELRRMIQEPQQASERATAYQQYEKNPLKEQLNIELVNLRGRLRSAQRLKEDLEQQVEKQQGQLKDLPSEQMAYSRLVTEKLRYEDELQNTEQVMKAAEMMLKVGKGELDLYLNASKASPSSSFIVDLLPLLGFLVGAFAGLSLAAFVEVIDPKIRTSREANKTYNIPTILTIPEMTLLSKGNAERRLRFFVSYLQEALERRLGEQDSISFALTSSQAGEGKSTLCYLLARYYQRLNHSVVYVQFDPEKNPYFEDLSTPERSIEAYLRGNATLDEVIMEGDLPRLCTFDDPDMKELIKASRMAELMEQLGERYDVVVVDAPGIIQHDYALNVMEYVDESLFIIGSNKVTRKFVNASLEEADFHGVWPMGIVLNRALKIFIDDVRIQQETRRNRVGLLTRLKSLLQKENEDTRA